MFDEVSKYRMIWLTKLALTVPRSPNAIAVHAAAGR